MKLLEQILSELGFDPTDSITLSPGRCCYLKNVGKVVDFTPAHVVVTVGKRVVTLEGEGLSVGAYFEGDLLVKGAVAGLKIE